jgi:hypothetical protein
MQVFPFIKPESHAVQTPAPRSVLSDQRMDSASSLLDILAEDTG